MKFLPIFYKINGKTCVVVGGGGIAARKVDLLRKAGARVTVISPALGDEMSRFHADGLIEWIDREYRSGDLDEAVLVIAATSDREVNNTISGDADAMRIPCNVVDNPDQCSFIMPSIINRDPVQIAVSTGGASPVLARLIRTNLESCTPSAYGKLATLVDNYRDSVKKTFTKVEERRKFWESILEGPVA
jgi:uroporphyrin-III C-methyltransferase/precorrin-2 dehydrogenase/sirohydrochlorin ferrochelatase